MILINLHALSQQNRKDDYSQFVEEGIIMNSIAVILVGLGLIIPFAVRRANSPANSKVYVTERL